MTVRGRTPFCVAVDWKPAGANREPASNTPAVTAPSTPPRRESASERSWAAPVPPTGFDLEQTGPATTAQRTSAFAAIRIVESAPLESMASVVKGEPWLRGE